MHRATELVGKGIVTADGGERVGRAADLLLNEGGDRIVAIVIAGGVLSRERVLPYEDVQTLGRDAIVARSQQHVMGAREWHDRGLKVLRSSDLKDRRVVTRDGREVGSIADVYVDARTGEVQAYDVVDPAFGGLISRRRLLQLQGSGEVVVGPDVVLVSTEAAARLEAEEAIPDTADARAPR